MTRTLCFRQETAKAYTAACTPDFFLFDAERKLADRGQLDDSRPGNSVPVTGRDLRAALDAVLAAQPLKGEQKPSLGCNIKWKPGNQPDYYTAASLRQGIFNWIVAQLKPRFKFW